MPTRSHPVNVQLLAIPQLVNPGEVRDESLLPSFLYLPGSSDFPAGAIALPWDAARPFVVGRLAQKRGIENVGPPGLFRQVVALAFRAWTAPRRCCPSALRKASTSSRPWKPAAATWNICATPGTISFPTRSFARQQVLVTVPASFDAVARELTLEAATQAGYQNITLLEEPQAAFYAWIERHPDWRERVRLGDLILVVDIGGGTTDFTLIAVTETGGELSLNRVAVGEHILLGGDNIDLALAGVVSQRLAEKGTRIDSRQLQALWNNCRAAKEKLLEPGNTATEQPVTILGKGSGLVGGTIKATLLRSDIEQVLQQGFLPATASSEMPAHQRRMGLQELGLPYAADAGITRHMAKFLRQQAAQTEQGTVRRGPSGLACPTHVLFNGGVLNASLVRERLLSTLDSWLAEEGMSPVKPLSGEDLMHAVSRGAAYYGVARTGRGVRIRGGVPRTYYVAVESAMPSIPGFPAPLEGSHGGAVRHGRRHRYPHPRARIRPGGGPARGVPLLHLRRAQERSAGRPDRRYRRGTGRAFPHGGQLRHRRNFQRSRAGHL